MKRPMIWMAAAAAAMMMSLPMAALGSDTAPMAKFQDRVSERVSGERLSAAESKHKIAGVSVGRQWMKQARVSGLMINLRLYTPTGDSVNFLESLSLAEKDTTKLCLQLICEESSHMLMMQLDQHAVDVLKRTGITQIALADTKLNVIARYQVSELDGIRRMFGLSDREQLCVSGKDEPVTVVSEDGVRRQITE